MLFKIMRFENHENPKEVFRGNKRKCNDKLKTLRSSHIGGYHKGHKGPRKVEFKIEDISQ